MGNKNNKARIKSWAKHFMVHDIQMFMDYVTLLEGFYGRSMTVNFEDIEFLRLAKYLTLNKKDNEETEICST